MYKSPNITKRYKDGNSFSECMYCHVKRQESRMLIIQQGDIGSTTFKDIKLFDLRLITHTSINRASIIICPTIRYRERAKPYAMSLSVLMPQVVNITVVKISVRDINTHAISPDNNPRNIFALKRNIENPILP